MSLNVQKYKYMLIRFFETQINFIGITFEKEGTIKRVRHTCMLIQKKISCKCGLI